MADDTYLMLGEDGTVRPVDLGPMMRRHRAAHIKARADAVGQAVDLLMIESVPVDEAWETAGTIMPPGMIGAAANVVLELREIEMLRED